MLLQGIEHRIHFGVQTEDIATLLRMHADHWKVDPNATYVQSINGPDAFQKQGKPGAIKMSPITPDLAVVESVPAVKYLGRFFVDLSIHTK